MTIRVYTWEDEGAPVLPNVTSQRLIDNLRIILKACLVDGYGDKPGAGWTLGHDLPDGFSLGNGNGWLNVVYHTNTSVTVYAIEEITDFSTPEAGGVNKRSGEFSDGYSSNTRMRPQIVGLTGTYNGGLAWYVIADERTATFMYHGSSSSTYFVVDPHNSYSSGWHFGDYITLDETPGFLAMCGNKTSGSGAGSPCWTSTGTVVLRNPFTGLVDQGSNPSIQALIGRYSASSSIHNSFNLPLLNRFSLARAGLVAAGFPETYSSLQFGTPIGTLRGVLYSTELSTIYSEKVLKTVFGFESPQVEDKFRHLPNILRPDHPGLFLAYPNAGDLGAFISLDPADWE